MRRKLNARSWKTQDSFVPMLRMTLWVTGMWTHFADHDGGRSIDDPRHPVSLKQYCGKVVLLDFWATWCHGCKEEIPRFSDFERKYARRGLAVIGVSMDDAGWKVVKPFLATADVPYRIILGDEPTANKYNIQSMPDTFLIDRSGRIAATYVGLVDKDDLENSIRAVLSLR